jgi:hypothetical protein
MCFLPVCPVKLDYDNLLNLEGAYGEEGSHVILQTESPAHHRLAVPKHTPLRVGTLNAILRAVSRARGIEKEDILRQL